MPGIYFCHISSWMRLGVNLTDTRMTHVCVDLRCGDVGMTEHFLYGTKVCTDFHKMGRK